MPGGYWWECENCSEPFNFQTACGSKGIAHFIQDQLKKEWNQEVLMQNCPKCLTNTLRITYEFPKKVKQLFRVYYIVGIDYDNGKYIQMMFETRESPKYDIPIFDFKYIAGRSSFGLNKAATLTQDELKTLFKLYCEKTGKISFP